MQASSKAKENAVGAIKELCRNSKSNQFMVAKAGGIERLVGVLGQGLTQCMHIHIHIHTHIHTPGAHTMHAFAYVHAFNALSGTWVHCVWCRCSRASRPTP